jgi:hypothetical protein
MRWHKNGSLDKAHRPPVDEVADCRLRHPAVQEEIEDRVAIMAGQYERRRRIRHLPYLGSGQSARADHRECADESERVLGDDD